MFGTGNTPVLYVFQINKFGAVVRVLVHFSRGVQQLVQFRWGGGVSTSAVMQHHSGLIIGVATGLVLYLKMLECSRLGPRARLNNNLVQWGSV